MADRPFWVGESVHLTARIAKPGSKIPTDPASIALTSLKREGTELLPDPVPFLKVQEGEYIHTIQTTNFTPGTYTLVVEVSDGETGVSLGTDQFVLRPLP